MRGYGFHLIRGKAMEDELAAEMAKALDVTVTYEPRDANICPDDDYIGVAVNVFKVENSDLHLVIGQISGQFYACGRIITTAYLKYADQEFRDISEAPSFDLSQPDLRYGQILGVFSEPKDDDDFFFHQ